MTTRPTELEERVERIANRASVGQVLVVHALLGKVGLPKTLVELTPEETDLVLRAAREWSVDYGEPQDPGPYQLHQFAEAWQQLRVARGAEA